jgi:hypothetical protein
LRNYIFVFRGSRKEKVEELIRRKEQALKMEGPRRWPGNICWNLSSW